MAIDDVYVIEVHSTYQQNPNIYCFNYRVVVEGDTDNLIPDLLTFGEDELQTDMLTIHMPAVLFPCVTARQVWPNSSLGDITATPAVAGSKTGTVSLPGQCSNVWTLFSDKNNPTPRNRGRDFFFGADVADIVGDGSKYDAAYLAEWVAFYTATAQEFTSGNGNTFQWCVFSRTQALENIDPQFVSNGGAVPDPPTFGNEPAPTIIYVRSDGLVRTQRRRQPEDPCAEFTTLDVPTV